MIWATALLVLTVCAFPKTLRRNPLAVLEERLMREQPATLVHGERVAETTLRVAESLGKSASVLFQCARLHDVGKLEVSNEILDKPGPLSFLEIEIMREHSSIGARMLEQLDQHEMARIVRYHHEWVNGKGYPDGIRGDAIPLESRIISVVDAYDAMVNDGRAYRESKNHDEAIAELQRCSGTQFDPMVVAAFMEVSLPRDRR